MPEWIKQISEKLKNMKKRNWIILGVAVALLLLLAVILVWNGSKDQELTEMTGFTFDLKSTDADSLLAGKFSGRGYTFTLQEEEATAGDAKYFVYHVSDAGGELAQGLAVDKASGEVCGYDFADGTVIDYEQSVFYDEKQDKTYSWDGIYENKETGVQVSMVPVDDFTFELTITQKGTQKLFGSCTAEGDTARYEGEDFAFTIKMTDGKIQITDTSGESKFSGTYLQK